MKDGTFTSVEFTAPCQTWFYGINNEEQVVGSGNDMVAFDNKSFLFSDGQFSIIDVPGSFVGGARGINNAGQIVGDAAAGGFLYDQGSFSFFNVPGAEGTWANGINDSGHIVGNFVVCSTVCDEFCSRVCTFRGYLLSDGVFSTIAFPGAGNTAAVGINNASTIVGFYTFTDGYTPPSHGFILENGTYSTLDFPGSTSTTLAGINNRGEIVGVYTAAPVLPGELVPVQLGFLARPALEVNNLVHLDSMKTSFDPTPVAEGPDGTFSIEGRFTNTSSVPVQTPQFVVTTLSGGNVLLDADRPPGIVGARLTPDAGADGVLSPGESMTVRFVIGLQQRRAFAFLVDLLGVSGP
jgi:hypothetical protein